MVHRPADSRLLTNLLSHEKDYAKHLAILLDYSQSALASFSAYASASAPPTSQVIIAVAGALAGADDALRGYAAAVDRWQEQLRALRAMEEDVGNIMRDREILVTRLIKASKSQKPTRDSILGGGSPSGSSLSVSKPEVQVGHKLSVAQAELQACEAHLAAKEQELHAFRAHTIRAGLQARCRAMVECGWKWGEMGKEGMRALETLDAPSPNAPGIPPMHPYLHKPLPGFEKPGSDVSSIAPSQSASQIGITSPPGTLADATWLAPSQPTLPTPAKPYTLQIPPAHSISEYAVPNGLAQPETIVEEAGGSSEEEEEEANVEVHENPRFQNGKSRSSSTSLARPPQTSSNTQPQKQISFSVRAPKTSPSEPHLPSSYSVRESPKKRGMLGGLAALFHVGGYSRKDSEGSTTPPKASGRWQSRIDRNLRRRGDDSSDDEGPPPSHYFTRHTESPQPILLTSPTFPTGGELGRLKKRTSKRSSVQAQPKSQMVANIEKGYVSDTVTDSISKARAKSGTRQRSASKPVGSSLRAPEASGRLKKAPAITAVFVEGGSALSRNSSLSKQSIASAASAPPRMATVPHPHAALGRQNSSPRKRTASYDPKPTPASGQSSGHRRSASISAGSSPLKLTSGEPSLMSIVEGLSSMNKQAAFKQDPSRLLVVPKAPGPVNVNIRDSWAEVPVVPSVPYEAPAPSQRRERPNNAPQGEEGNYRNSLLLAGSISAPSLPLSTPNGSQNSQKALPKMPLRSALRNSSRTPSPAPASLPQVTRPALVNGDSTATIRPALIASPSPVPFAASTTINIAPVLMSASPQPRAQNHHGLSPLAMMQRRESDVSVSSYDTGIEDFEDAPETPPPPTPSPPEEDNDAQHIPSPTPSPPRPLPPPINTNTLQEQAPPRRRKSVRMSLPPTFSTTPPALDDDDGDEASARHAPWSAKGKGTGNGNGNGHANPGPAPPAKAHPQRNPAASTHGNGNGNAIGNGWGSRIEESYAKDVWEDSSDEDAEYSAAKRLLSRLSRKAER
ncbi:uncharacterized protein BXZ73DRAFT_54222 [Epithele typhae]|uniref:uncharacterized protein n=1 Tax=Epithele typhae TaxID=378194 RepID=UPI002007FC07|nr:uncharacterized protein BXZ73DRAFT_54222 [Epithele typhae]KAH9915586.1 hypothetical protein BXZ73DRAFT_54222 [Epithele typhae]